jgi:hypothetical protein
MDHSRLSLFKAVNEALCWWENLRSRQAVSRACQI